MRPEEGKILEEGMRPEEGKILEEGEERMSSEEWK